MSPDKLVMMANQIATFFDTQPDGKAAENVAAHLRDFWAPDMRERFKAHVAAGGEGLRPTASQAAAHL